jgi:tetratricopeptide (TPR) repeat protein
MDEFRLSARLDPTFASPHNDLGVELFKIPARRAESIHELETAIRLDNDLGRAHMNLGMALIDTPGRLVDAIPQFKEALRVDPRDIKAHLGMATVCMKTGLWPEAIAHLDAAQRIAPTPERQALLNRMIDDHPNLVIPPDAASDPTHDVTINTIH